MKRSPRRAAMKLIGVLTIGATAVGFAFGPTGVAGAGQAVPHLHRVHASTKTVHPGGTFTIVAHARYRVAVDYEVIFTFDPTKVALPDETCDDGSGPQNADNPSCEYDNRFLPKTVTIGYFQVAPNASGTIAVTACARDLQTGTHADCKVRRIRIT